MRSIKWKLVFMYITLVFIVLIISGTFIIISVRGNEDSKAEEELKRFSGTIEENIIRSGYDDFQEGFKELGGITGRNLEGNIIETEYFKTIASTATTDRSKFPDFASEPVIFALRGEAHFSSGARAPDINGITKQWMEYAKPVMLDPSTTRVNYVIYVRMDATLILESVSQTVRTIVLSVFLALILAGFLGFWFSSTITSPIIALTNRAKEFAGGNLDTEVPVYSGDEIGQLSKNFNLMARELNKTMAETEGEKNKLEIVLFNMTDGVLAYDGDGKLIHANQLCGEMLALDNIGSLSFSEMLAALFVDRPSPWPQRSVQEINSFEKKSATVQSGEKYISLSLNAYKNKDGNVDGVILVLQDVTKHIMLDNLRKEFVANVSHEIRTPITTIKSYAETLLDGETMSNRETATEFLTVINDESDRMTLLVKDLLELSSLDNNQFYLDMKEENLIDIIKQSVKQLKFVAEKQKKQLNFTPGKSEMLILADRGRIGQVVNNIITNAIKYSYEKAVIDVEADDTGEYYQVSVTDNGMGIPQEDLSRIFERFYRVDKARSRALGGTGLGLSIAKEIMEAHNGGISAESALGKGTTMKLMFEKLEARSHYDGN